jgi:hypothetical protein
MKLEFSRHIFEKSSNIKFNKNPCNRSRVAPCGQTEGQTDMTKLVVASRSFMNAANDNVPESFNRKLCPEKSYLAKNYSY